MDDMKIFIAESSPGIYERFVRLVGAVDGMEVTGKNGQPAEAVQNILAASPDAVILDGGFGGGKGVETLRQIKSDNPRTVVFIVSDFPNPHYKKKCMEAGADFFFDKSNEIEFLLEALKTLAHKSV